MPSTASKVTEVSSSKCFGGQQKYYKHESVQLKREASFSVFVPAHEDGGTNRMPVVYWLSGLTCTESNFPQKSGFQRYAARLGLVVVAPDTSPRGCNLPGEDDSWDFGSGAGFYVDATEEPWKENYRMYSYVTEELPSIISANFPVLPDRQSIMGHSMGGHGALVCALRNPGKYRCATAFAPICNPSDCPWGKKAFTGYLGSDAKKWEEYDATHLVQKYMGPSLHLVVEQGDCDQFLLDGQLLPERFQSACNGAGIPLEMNTQEGYDHSYYFISSFIGDHLEHHAKHLKD